MCKQGLERIEGNSHILNGIYVAVSYMIIEKGIHDTVSVLLSCHIANSTQSNCSAKVLVDLVES